MVSRLAPLLATSAILASTASQAATSLDLPDVTAPWSPPTLVNPGEAAVAPFILASSDAAARGRATACLTSAIYYEAATEPRAGQEAVAQVVLNRVRHPAFPKSVCAVVYQGVGGPRACQFTFACDGSMARRPVAWRWEAAQQVAMDALAGHVAAGIGAATHYHTAWVHPYWPSLIETTRIGAHIFYHMAGARGSSASLTGQYDGDEPANTPAALAVAGRVIAGAAPPRPTVAQFSPWGLDIATVSAKRGIIVVKTPS